MYAYLYTWTDIHICNCSHIETHAHASKDKNATKIYFTISVMISIFLGIFFPIFLFLILISLRCFSWRSKGCNRKYLNYFHSHPPFFLYINEHLCLRVQKQPMKRFLNMISLANKIGVFKCEKETSNQNQNWLKINWLSCLETKQELWLLIQLQFLYLKELICSVQIHIQVDNGRLWKHQVWDLVIQLLTI